MLSQVENIDSDSDQTSPTPPSSISSLASDAPVVGMRVP